jgi:hypothetical protein
LPNPIRESDIVLKLTISIVQSLLKVMEERGRREVM